MPVVPRADQSLIAQAPLPGARLPTNVPAEAFGVPGAGIDLSGAQQHVRAIDQDARQKADQIAFVAADAKASALETSLLYHPDTGALNQKGRNAFTVGPAVEEAWGKGVADIADGLKLNDQQQAVFNRSVGLRWAGINQQLAHHVAAEQRQYDHDTTLSLVANEHDAAVANIEDPQRIGLALARQAAALKDLGRRNGYSDEQTAQAIQGTVSKTHLSVLEQILAAPEEKGGGDLRASRYLEAHRDALVGHDLIQAEKLTEAGSVLGESQRQADIIMRGGVESAGPPTLDKALADAGTIVDPRVREATERRVRQAFMDQVSNAHEQQVQAFHQASSTLESSGGNFDAIPLALRIAMSPEQNSALQHRADQIRHPRDYGDEESYFNLLHLSALPAARQQFLAEDLVKDYPDLNARQRTRLLNLQREMSTKEEGRVHADSLHAQVQARFEAADRARYDDGMAKAARLTDPAERKAEEARVTRHYDDMKAAHRGAAPAAAAPGAAPPPAVGSTPTHPLDGLLTPAPVETEPTPRMLTEAAQSPAYAALLRRLHVKLPAVLPTPAPVKK